MWFTDLYRKETFLKDGIFSKEEIEILDNFNKILRFLYPKGQNVEVVNINLLKNDQKWTRVVQEARKAID